MAICDTLIYFLSGQYIVWQLSLSVLFIAPSEATSWASCLKFIANISVMVALVW